MIRTNIIRIAGLIIVLGGIGLVAAAFQTGFFGLMPKTLTDDANRIIADCAAAPDVPACYDLEIPRLMDGGLTMEEAFKVTSIIQSKTDGYFYCHVLGHELAGKETAKDPSKWTEVIARCPVDMCSYGCLHGAAAERFRAESLPPNEVTALIPEIAKICESGMPSATELERASCYHALGHLSMYMSSADVPTALAVCEKVTAMNHREDWKQICYGGVFMQIFQPLEPEDVALVSKIPAKTKAEAETYCKTFSGLAADECHTESWPLYSLSLKQPGGVAAFCENRSNAEQVSTCYNNIFYVLAVQLGFDVNKLQALCESVPQQRRGQCYGNIASRFLETNEKLTPKAVSLCEAAKKEGVGDRCYKELLFYSTYNYAIGSDDFKALCGALPEPWKTSCLRGDGNDTHFNTNSL